VRRDCPASLARQYCNQLIRLVIDQERTMKQHSKSVPQSSSEGKATRAPHVISAERQEQLVDQALMDTFPASDPAPLYSFD